MGATGSYLLPKALLHGEGAVLLGLAVLLYVENGESWVLFVVLLLTPDVGMLGYLAGSRFGATAYNVFHSYPAPGAVRRRLGLLLDRPLVVAVGLIWFAHIGMDRLFGFGPKCPTNFQDTPGGFAGRSRSRPTSPKRIGKQHNDGGAP